MGQRRVATRYPPWNDGDSRTRFEIAREKTAMKDVFLRGASGRKARGRRKTHLQVERLDDRSVPSTLPFIVTNPTFAGRN